MRNSNIQAKTAALPVRIAASLFSKEGHARYGRRAYPIKKLLTSLCTVLVLIAALTARGQTATVLDPQGDAFYSEGHEAPAFLDILAASFTISDTLTFTVDVAGSLDALPNPPGNAGIFAWHFPLNTDPSTNPPGFPVAQGQKIFTAEFFTDAQWDGTAFRGVFVDRRPTLAGGTALQYSIPVSVSGSRIIVTVPPTLAAEVRAAVMLPGATWNCSTVLDTNYLFPTGPEVGDNGFHEAGTIGRQPWPQ
jgi:hypothetical protein